MEDEVTTTIDTLKEVQRVQTGNTYSNLEILKTKRVINRRI